jgi:hypothetical protein
MYEDTLNTLRSYFGNTLTINCDTYYIRFEDPEVQRICAVNWGDHHTEYQPNAGGTGGYDLTVTAAAGNGGYDLVDGTYVQNKNNTGNYNVVATANTGAGAYDKVEVGDGITPAQAAAVSSLGTKFQGNNSITSFNELQYFTGLGNLNSAFLNCKYLVSAIMPNQITSTNATFRSAMRFKNVTLPTNLTTLGDNTFNSTAIESITLPSSLTGIGTNAFYFAPLKNIDIPASVTSIGTASFQNCTSLETVTVRRTTPPTMSSSNAFGGCSRLTAIYVPSESVSAYKSAQNWSTYASKIQAIPEL